VKIQTSLATTAVLASLALPAAVYVSQASQSRSASPRPLPARRRLTASRSGQASAPMSIPSTLPGRASPGRPTR